MDYLNIIANSLSIPEPWIKSRIVSAKNYNPKFPRGWLINSEFGIPFCFVAISDSRLSIEFDEKTISEILREENPINLAIEISEGKVSTIYRWNFYNKKIQRYVGKFDVFKLVEPRNFFKKRKSQNGRDSDLKPITSKIEGTIFQIHSFLRDIDGLHPDTALDEICKLLYIKLYDEEITKNGEFYRFQRNRYSMSEECASAIRELYKEANEHDIRVFSLRIPGYKRSRGVFDAPLLLSSEAISKSVEHLQALSFSTSGIDLKGRIFQNLISPVLRGGFGQYFTPLEVVNFIIDLCKPTLDDLIIDPFAGSGHFLTSSIRYVKNTNADASHKKIDDFLFTHLHGMEISERMVRISMTDMRLHGDGHSNIRCVDALLDFSNYQDLSEGSFDIVVTNPPFGSLVNFDNSSKFSEFLLASKKKNTPLEVLGIERSVQLLREKGKLAIILPDSIFVNSNLKYVRDYILSNLQVVGLISLPIETFTPFGASIKTTILLARKKDSKRAIGNNSKVFIAEIKKIGYDASGRKSSSSDLLEVLRAFNQFVKNNKIVW